jgi:hypothetical protein
MRTDRQTSPETSFIKADDIIKHAQWIIVNGVLIAPPQEFEPSSRWNYLPSARN